MSPVFSTQSSLDTETISFASNTKKIEGDGEDTSLSTRLRYAMSRVRINQSELARIIGVKPQVVQYLCKSPVVKSKFTYQIAAALGISYAWLAEGKGDITSQNLAANSKQNAEFKIPVIAWSESADWVSESLEFNAETHEQWTFTCAAVNDSCFALKVRDSSMQPRFDFGTTLIVDPTEKPYTDSFVIVHIASLNETLLRQWVTVDGRQVLRPMNDALYKDLNFDEDKDQILGVVVQAHIQFSPK